MQTKGFSMKLLAKFPIALCLVLTSAIPSLAAPQLRKIHSAFTPARAFRGQTMSLSEGSFAFAQEAPAEESDRSIQRLGYIWYGNQVRPMTMRNSKERITSFSIVGVQGNSAFLSASYLPPGVAPGPAQEALFWTTANRLQMLIGPGTLLPGGDRVKTFKTAEVGPKGVAFVAIGQSGKKGIYLVTHRGIERIVDQTTLIPGKNLTEFTVSQLSLSGKNIAFSGLFGSPSSRQGAIYAYRSGKLEQVVDAGNRVAVESRTPDAIITGAQVGLTSFPGQGLYESAGVYVQSSPGKPLTIVANNGTVFPDRPTVPNSQSTSSSSNLCLSSTYSVFINENEAGRTMFVKTAAGLQKIVSVGDRLDNKVVKDIHASGRYCNGKQLGLAIEFPDEVAIYQVTPDLPVPPVQPPPTPTPTP
jgi:hypothetical protein